MGKNGQHRFQRIIDLWQDSKLELLLVGLVAAVAIYIVASWIQRVQQRHGSRTMVRTVVDSEELILQLTPRLKGLNQGILNLQLPDHHGYPLLDTQIDVIDLESGAVPGMDTQQMGTIGMASGRWPVQVEGREIPSKQLDMWGGLLDTVDYFDHAKFYIVRGNFSPTDPNVFRTDVGFVGLAFLKNGKWRAVKAKQEVQWRYGASAPTDTEQPPDWRIFAWHLKSLQITDSKRLWFEETLDHALPDYEQRRHARKSHHVDYVIGLARNGVAPLANDKHRRYFEQNANGQHPGLSVADVDNDGWDDLYVMSRWGRNQLLHNQGDGTFIERAAQLGLDINGVSSSGIFADFDNDGDKDLMLGRTLERSMYLVNEAGRFVDRSAELVTIPLPYLVTSVSAADYNGDGLLDVYLSTYGLPGGPEQVQHWAREFLSEKEADILMARLDDPNVDNDRFINRIGPPNKLLVNRGEGRFEVAPENDQVSLGYNSFQATWADFDKDGDPDLYVSNDFAPDYFLRNDGAGGFSDITTEAGGNTMRGFGMGASWGDYDNDGHQDLYISNMYSKAGMRIIAQIPDLDSRFQRSADGNRLYRGLGNRFELVSGSQPPAMLVTQAGWSWGGQFMDIDNDGFLDIYVTSGYDTIPDEVATDVDL